jgi:predicted GNAT family acetyltransferase
MTIQHHPEDQAFTAGPAAAPAELAYSLPAPGVIDFTHTFVPEDQRGQGQADELARTGLAYAREQHLKVRVYGCVCAAPPRRVRRYFGGLKKRVG